jgi:hypothetical protein
MSTAEAGPKLSASTPIRSSENRHPHHRRPSSSAEDAGRATMAAANTSTATNPHRLDMLSSILAGAEQALQKLKAPGGRPQQAEYADSSGGSDDASLLFQLQTSRKGDELEQQVDEHISDLETRLNMTLMQEGARHP